MRGSAVPVRYWGAPLSRECTACDLQQTTMDAVVWKVCKVNAARWYEAGCAALCRDKEPSHPPHHRSSAQSQCPRLAGICTLALSQY